MALNANLGRAALAALLLFGGSAVVWAENWPRFRGPNGAGQSDAADIPSEFTADDYLWRALLPVVGHSSPVVWNGQVFVTSADPETAELTVLAFDLATGSEKWQRRYPGGPHSIHETNSFATSTPAVDDERIYVAWKRGDTVMLAAITHDGKAVWDREVSPLTEGWGFGASPVVVGDVVVLGNDTKDVAESAIYGFDPRTGSQIWRTACASGKTTYAAPLVWESPDAGPLLVFATMESGLSAYDPKTGRKVWNALTADLPDRCVSSPVMVGDLVLVSCGSGNNGLHLLGAKLTSAAEAPTEVYRLKQSIPNIPTPVVAGNIAFLWYDGGVVTAIDGPTGEVHWRKRVGGKFHSSPICIGDRIFGISLEGEVDVLRAGKDYELIARNQLGEPVTATPAVADGRLLIRTERSLICLGTKP
jgi:outer membrane protein assembly factor BamB